MPAIFMVCRRVIRGSAWGELRPTSREELTVPQYAILQSHPPDNCPMSNAKVRAHALAVLPQLEERAKAKGIEITVNVHLDPAHRALMIFDAPSAESVRDLVYEGGFMQFTEMELFLITPIPELVQRIDQFPTVF